MKLKEKVSWLMDRVQRSLFPHIEDCCYLPLTTQEKHIISILEIVEIERHIQATWSGFGRPMAERKVLARCFLAKSVLRYPTTRDLINYLKSNPNLKTICGFKSLLDYSVRVHIFSFTSSAWANTGAINSRFT